MAIKRNLHSIDMFIRIISGMALVYVGFIGTDYIQNGAIRMVFGSSGVINIVVALMRSCPMYFLAGISTFHEKSEDDD